MSFIMVAGYQGFQQEQEYKKAESAAKKIKADQLGRLGEQEGLTVQTAQLGYKTGQENIGMGANMELRRTQVFGEQSYAQSNLATSGTIESKVQTDTEGLLGKYKTDMTKLFETRDLSKAGADLAYRSGEMSAEEVYQNTLTGIESQPSTFMEGFTS